MNVTSGSVRIELCETCYGSSLEAVESCKACHGVGGFLVEPVGLTPPF